MESATADTTNSRRLTSLQRSPTTGGQAMSQQAVRRPEAAALKEHAFDHAPLGMILADAHGILIEVNPAYGEIVGRHPESLVGTPLRQMLSTEDGDATAGLIDALLAGHVDRIRTETLLLHGTNAALWVSVNASWIRDEAGTPLYLIGQFEDITERKTAAVAMAEAEERFRSTFDMAPIGMILTDTHGTLLRVNPAYSAIVGRDATQLVGTTVRALTHPDDLEDNATQVRALVAGTIDRLETEKRYLHADGHVVWASVSASCVRDSSGAPLYLIGQVEDITERRAMRERLAHAAIHDPLTDLPNRDLFLDRLEMALRRAQRSTQRVAVMFIDLDRFKLINDSLGHDVGDRLLRAVADRMRSALRSSDTLARFGGDEFTVLCDDVDDESHALEIAERIRLTMREPLSVAGGETFVSFSLGIALSTGAGDNSTTLIRHADLAMYRAKESGRARVEMYTEDDHEVAGRQVRTSVDLAGAIARGELELHYRPFAHLQTRTMVGVEALVRWRHPTHGLLRPEEFMVAKEGGGPVVELGAWALEQACRQAVQWIERRGHGPKDDRLNVTYKVAAGQLGHRGFPDLVSDILDRTGLDPDRLWLGFSESTLVHDAEAVVKILRTLREFGLHLGIDGFGTGYSSLAYLKQCPVEGLKIAPGFVRDVDRRSEDTAVVKAIIGVADSLGLLVVAEGVERWNQVERLEALGCNVAQGDLLGPPLSARDLGPYPTDDLGAWNLHFETLHS
jgi:diguanylate cyclase (GGDEF)-like protein/PAS domain S-box-containing protein